MLLYLTVVMHLASQLDELYNRLVNAILLVKYQISVTGISFNIKRNEK